MYSSGSILRRVDVLIMARKDIDPSAPAPRPPRRRRWRWVVRHALGLTFLAIVAVVAAIIALSTTQAGVNVLISELIARSGGALEIEGATGSLVDTVRARRIAWRGVATKVEATDVALTWLPSGLFSRSIVLTGLGARALTIEIQPSDEPVTLPDSLALPIDVRIERVAVGSLTWRVANGRGLVEGLEFGYAGGASAHRMTDLRMVTRVGTLSGDATLGAITPFSLTGAFKLEGDATLRDARINLAAKGTLASLVVDVDGRAGEGRVAGHATLAPLAAVPLVTLSIDARDVDLAAWDRALPSTRIAATVNAQPVDGGLAGTVDATNALAGNLETGRTPIRAFRARFAWRPDAVDFDDIAAELEGGAKATGSARIALGANVSGGHWALDVRDLDARQLYAPLVSTRLAGRVVADLDPARRTISGNLVDRRFVGGIAVDFAATFDDRTVDVTRLRARANGGELAGSGRLGFDGQRAFNVAATATHFDPSRFGAYPAGSLDAKVTATGALRPEWRVDADVVVAPGSRLAGAPLAGSVRGSASPNHLRNAAIDLAIGSATIKGSGSVGEPGDRMTATLDAPQLAELVPLLPAAIPHARRHFAHDGTDGGFAAGRGLRSDGEGHAGQALGNACNRQARRARGCCAVGRCRRARRFRIAFAAARRRGRRRENALGRCDACECQRCRDARRAHGDDRARWRRHRLRRGSAWRPDRRRREGCADGARLGGHDRFAVGSRPVDAAPCVSDDTVVRAAEGAPRRNASRRRRRHGRHRRLRMGRGQDHFARALCRADGREHCASYRSSVAGADDAHAGRRMVTRRHAAANRNSVCPSRAGRPVARARERCRRRGPRRRHHGARGECTGARRRAAGNRQIPLAARRQRGRHADDRRGPERPAGKHFAARAARADARRRSHLTRDTATMGGHDGMVDGRVHLDLPRRARCATRRCRARCKGPTCGSTPPNTGFISRTAASTHVLPTARSRWTSSCSRPATELSVPPERLPRPRRALKVQRTSSGMRRNSSCSTAPISTSW
jgi:hypothetical protein